MGEQSANKVIRANNIKKSYGSGSGKTYALNGANLEVSSGEVLAIMGPSGSGKSTLLHCITGVINADDGEIIIDGQNIKELSDKERTILRRQKFGFVFQFSQLVPELSAVDNVALPLLLNKVSRKESYERALAYLDKVGLKDHANQLSTTLSGGQAQRVAIARALVHNPKIIFADEPTGALDSDNSAKVMELFIQLAKDNGTTLVIVTHEPSVATYANRQVHVKNGVVSNV